MNITEPSDLSTDDDGAPLRFVNRYYCRECDQSWEDHWSCGCDDECPECGRDFTPIESTDLLAAYYELNPTMFDPVNDERPSPRSPKYSSWLSQPGSIKTVLDELKTRGCVPTMTAEEIHKLTRERDEL